MQGNSSLLEDLKELVICTHAFCVEFFYWTNEAVIHRSNLEANFSKMMRLLKGNDFEFLKFDFDGEQEKICKETVRIKLNSDTFEKIFKQVNDREKIIESIELLDQTLKSKIGLIDELNNKIDGLETRYNFVGLYSGFSDLYKEKNGNQ